MTRISSPVLITIGVIMLFVSLWINRFQLKGKFTLFIFLGFIILVWGLIKISRKKRAG